LMFIKWFKYSANNVAPYDSHCAPSILITFINMVLLKSPENVPPCEPYMFWGQGGLQSLLVFAAFLCIPWMLLAKPLHVMRSRKEAAHHPIDRQPVGNGDAEGGLNSDGMAGSEVQHAGHGHDEEDITEIFIHSGIHTVEYVLGSVSHTASYLRLWALSLAHAQLAEVLWNMVLRQALVIDSWYGGVCLWVIFAFWSVLTIGILVLMEGLSAFLHTLRLHWVEFQSKFYIGQGYAFQPFSFDIILEQSSNSAEGE